MQAAGGTPALGAALASPLVAALVAHLRCDLCRGTLVEPVALVPCLHRLCKGCVVSVPFADRVCPCCQQTITAMRPDSRLQAVIGVISSSLRAEVPASPVPVPGQHRGAMGGDLVSRLESMSTSSPQGVAALASATDSLICSASRLSEYASTPGSNSSSMFVFGGSPSSSFAFDFGQQTSADSIPFTFGESPSAPSSNKSTPPSTSSFRRIAHVKRTPVRLSLAHSPLDKHMAFLESRAVYTTHSSSVVMAKMLELLPPKLYLKASLLPIFDESFEEVKTRADAARLVRSALASTRSLIKIVLVTSETLGRLLTRDEHQSLVAALPVECGADHAFFVFDTPELAFRSIVSMAERLCAPNPPSTQALEQPLAEKRPLQTSTPLARACDLIAPYIEPLVTRALAHPFHPLLGRAAVVKVVAEGYRTAIKDRLPILFTTLDAKNIVLGPMNAKNSAFRYSFFTKYGDSMHPMGLDEMVACAYLIENLSVSESLDVSLSRGRDLMVARLVADETLGWLEAAQSVMTTLQETSFNVPGGNEDDEDNGEEDNGGDEEEEDDVSLSPRAGKLLPSDSNPDPLVILRMTFLAKKCIAEFLPEFMLSKESVIHLFMQTSNFSRLTSRSQAMAMVRKALKETQLYAAVLNNERPTQLIGELLPEGSLRDAALALPGKGLERSCYVMTAQQAREYVLSRVHLRMIHLSSEEIERLASRFKGVDEFVSRSLAHPFNPYVGKECAVVGVYRLLSMNQSERRELLRSKLVENGLELRSDSRFCRAYVEGTCGSSEAEVVAIVRVTSFLFQHGHRCWSHNHERFEEYVRRRVLVFGRSWEQAAEDAMSSLRVGSPESFGRRVERRNYRHYDYDLDAFSDEYGEY